jgi:gliding motility-associated-like protein
MASSLYAQVPDWSVNTSNYQYNMSLTLVMNMDYMESKDVNDVIGAFSNTTCVGKASPVYVPAMNRYVVYLTVYSNNSFGDSLVFKMYNKSLNAIYTASRKQLFVPNSAIGITSNPVVISSPRLSSDADILTFQVSNQQDNTMFNQTIVSAMVKAGTNLSGLTTTLTASAMAKTYFATSITGTYALYSSAGINFTNPIYLKVISADESVEKIYQIKVGISNASPTDISLLETKVLEGNLPNSVVAKLKTTDTDLTDSHTYSLVAGNGDDDNASFQINGDSLIALVSFDFETKASYRIRIKTSDGKFNGDFEKVFVLQIMDNKPSKLQADNIISPNGDGINDEWIIRNLQDFPNAKLSIFNRTGGLLYTTSDYKNDWKGVHNGDDLPSGTYYYVLSSNEGDYVGFVSIIR